MKRILRKVQILLFLLGIPAQAGIDDGLVLHLGFDAFSTNVVEDLSGSGNHGQIAGATHHSEGAVGGCFHFDGIDDEIMVSNSVTLNPTGAITVSAWMYSEGPGTLNGMVVFKGSAPRLNGAQYGLVYFPSTNASFSLKTSSTSWKDYLSSTTLVAGTWYHIAGTYAPGEVRFYVNGTLSSIRTGVSGNIPVMTGNLFVGSEHSYPADEYFKGFIDEVKIHNRALSEAEIQQLAGLTIPSNTPPVAVLAANPSYGSPPLQVDLDFSGSTDADGDMVLFELDLQNDGLYEFQTNAPGIFQAEYTNAGIFTAILRVTDATRLSSTSMVPIVVSSLPQGLKMQVAIGTNVEATAPDHSGNGNDGNILGATFMSNALCDGAYSFDGLDDEIAVSNGPALNPTNQFSVSAWMNCRGEGTFNGTIVLKGPSNNINDAQYALTYFPNNLQGLKGRVSFSLHTSGNGRWRDYYSTTTLSTGAWHHVAGTYLDGDLRLYVDGQLSFSTNVSGAVVASSGNLMIGANHSFPDDEYFNGSISDVRLYDRVLGAGEIAEMYGACRGNLPPVASLSASPAMGEPPLSVDFDFSASRDDNDRIVLYELDTDGDGTFEFGTNSPGTASTLYSTAGIYSATLRVTDTFGETDTETARIIVGAIVDDLVLHFDFDSDGNGQVLDKSPLGNNGAVDGATYFEKGHCGGAYWFDGVDDSIIVSNNPSLNITNEITISAWMRCFNSGNYNGIILCKGTPPLGGSAQYALVYFPDNLQGVQGKASFSIKTTSTSVWRDFYSQGTLDLNTWHHLAGTYKSGELKLYVNGVLSHIETGVTGIIPVEDGDLSIGAEHCFPNDEHFKGLIDDVRIYRRALSEAEIQYLYSTCVNEGPVATLSASPNEGFAPLAVTLDFSASHDPDGNLSLCELDQEGDGIFEFQTPTPGQVIATYNQPGTYYPQVRVCDAQAQKASASVPVTVWANTAPTAILEISPTNGVPPFDAAFVATNSTAAQERALVLYEFDVDGDNVFDLMSSNGLATYTYRSSGTYSPVLRVTDDLGLQATASSIVVVSAATNDWTAALWAEPSHGNVPLEVQFVAETSNSVPIASYRWDFDGDGIEDSVATTNTILHTYTVAGAYRATVTAIDESGASASADTRILVAEPPDYKVWISSPKEGDILWGEKISVIGHVAPANDTVALQFEFRKVGDVDWLALGEPLYPHPNSYKTDWNVTGLTDGTNYQFRAIASIESSQVATSSSYTVSIDSSGEKIVGRVIETEVDGIRQKEITFGNGQSAEVEVSDGTTVYLPAETVSSNATLQISLQGVDTNPAAGTATGLYNIQQNRRISLEADPQLRKELRVRIPYNDIDNDGIVDGTGIPEETLCIQYFDVETSQWKKTLSSVVHKDENYLESEVFHLTEFGVFGNANLLQPRMGGQLLSFSSEQATLTGKADNLVDGNPVSYWVSASTSLPQSFVYGFSNHMGAVVSQAVLYNYGETENGMTNFSKDFRILSSMDAGTYQVMAEGTLPANCQAQTFGFPAVTCRYVKLELTSGYSTTAVELAEFSVIGTPTNDADADQMRDSWEMDYFGSYSRSGEADFDGDGLTDSLEYQNGGNPLNTDTDGDGMDDWKEYVAGTGIDNHASVFAATFGESDVVVGQFAIRWDSVAGKFYKVYGNTNLLNPWPTSVFFEVVGDGSEKEFIPSEPSFYRISVE